MWGFFVLANGPVKIDGAFFFLKEINYDRTNLKASDHIR